MVDGATSAVKADRAIPWDQLLDLLRLIVADETADGSIRPLAPLVRDPGLSWTRSSIASLLEAAIRNGSSGLALGRRDRVFSIIEQLTADSDPTPARCSEAAENDPLLTIALNSIRGQGLRLVIDYLVWLHGQGVCESIDGSPEVLQLIDTRLAEEPSPAVLSVLGRHFTTTVALDQEWAASLADRLFASRLSETDRHDPWCAYLAEGVTLRAFRTLEPFYERHVARLGESAEIGDCERNLVHHLLPVYWWGEIGEIDSGDEGLIGRLFATAPPALRAYAVEYAGLSLYRTEGVLDENVARRFRALWNWRRTSAESAVDRVAHASEAQAFEWWFTSDKLDEQWSLENLEWTLEVGPGPRHPHATALRLGVIARRSPAKLAPVLHCYELLIAAADENSQLLGWVEDLRDPLSWAITTGQDEAAASGRAIANMLVARGFLGFRDLAR